jgi:hypothetical protein
VRIGHTDIVLFALVTQLASVCLPKPGPIYRAPQKNRQHSFVPHLQAFQVVMTDVAEAATAGASGTSTSSSASDAVHAPGAVPDGRLMTELTSPGNEAFKADVAKVRQAVHFLDGTP